LLLYSTGTNHVPTKAGGNFIDKANVYQSGESETWIGEWLQQRDGGIRDWLVVATEYTVDHQLQGAGPGKKDRTGATTGAACPVEGGAKR